MYHFIFHQSHISEKNMDRLRVLLDDPDEGVRNMAYVLIRVAVIRPYRRTAQIPHRRKRLKYLLKVDRMLAQDSWRRFSAVNGLTWNTRSTMDRRLKILSMVIGQCG